MTPKRFLLALGAFLGIGAGVVAFVPQAAPLVVPLKSLGELVTSHASSMPEPCPDSWCARDKDGKCHVCGPVNPRDGGAHCVCR